MSGVAELPATGSAVDLGGHARAARTALAADAVVVVEAGAAGPAVVARDGLTNPEAAAVARALPVDPAPGEGPEAVDVPGFRAGLYWRTASAPYGAVGLCALRRESGAFEHRGLGAAFARHAACALGVDRWAGPAPVEEAPAPDGAALFEVSSWSELTRAVADEGRRIAGAGGAGVLVWDAEAGTLQLLPGSFDAAPELTASARAAPVDWWSCAARVFSTGQPYLANDMATDAGVLREYMDAFGISQMASVVLEAGGRRVGVLELVNKPEGFAIADLVAAGRIARRLALAVHVARGRFALERRHRLEEILGRIAVDIAAGRSLQEFLGAALDDLCDATDAAMLAVVPRAAEPVVWRRGPGRPDLEAIVLEEGHQATGVRAHVVASRGPGDAGWAVLHVPIALDGEHVATLSALRARGERFDRDEWRALSRLASLTALAWATERYQRHQAQLARLAERERIGEELHDHIAQLLFAARLSLESALEVTGVPAPALAAVRQGRDLVVRGDTAIRRAIRELAPPVDDELGSRLAATVGGVEEEFGHPVQLEISPPAAEAGRALGPSRTALLAKVAREALVNAAKHAGPCQMAVRLTLTRRGRLLLAISDDGVGLSARRRDGGHGLASLRRAVRHHGGTLRLDGAPTGGTRVSVSLPL